MDELSLIRSFRADVPPPSAAAITGADRAWRQSGTESRRWRPRLVLGTGLAAAVAALAIALVLPADRDGSIGPVAATAAETLRRAASAVGGGVDRPLRPGEFWYVRRQTAWATMTAAEGPGYAVIAPEVREDWVGVDGSRHWRTRPDGEPRFPGPRDRERWEAAGRPPVGTPSEHETGPQGAEPFHLGGEALSYAGLLELPREPRQLYARLRAAAVACRCGNSVDEETFVIVGDVLRDVPLTAELRAALLRAAALIPGIELVERERDVAGREGVGVAFEGAGQRRVLIFDRDTYELLGENERLLGRSDQVDAEAGTLIGGSADLASAIVGSPSARP